MGPEAVKAGWVPCKIIISLEVFSDLKKSDYMSPFSESLHI